MEIYTLRKEPLVEISILENSFVLKKEANQQEGGEYEFSKIDSLRLDRRINWLVSVFSFITALVTSSGGDVYKERDVMKFSYNKKSFGISLKGCNLDLALKAINDINQRIKNK